MHYASQTFAATKYLRVTSFVPLRRSTPSLRPTGLIPRLRADTERRIPARRRNVRAGTIQDIHPLRGDAHRGGREFRSSDHALHPRSHVRLGGHQRYSRKERHPQHLRPQGGHAVRRVGDGTRGQFIQCRQPSEKPGEEGLCGLGARIPRCRRGRHVPVQGTQERCPGKGGDEDGSQVLSHRPWNERGMRIQQHRLHRSDPGEHSLQRAEAQRVRSLRRKDRKLRGGLRGDMRRRDGVLSGIVSARIRVHRGAGIPLPDVHQGQPSEVRAVHGYDGPRQGRDSPSEHSGLASVKMKIITTCF